jgi:LuxR family transcriptional regulator, maltose regulon positive regulatory protein
MIAAAGGDVELEAARRHFEDAVDLFTTGGGPYEAARARQELAEVLARSGQLDAAIAEAQSALETLQQLGAAREAERSATLLGDVRGTRGEHVRGSRFPTRLTARELEVLRLVARGLSDREISAALGLSEHTAHRHVANILTKLDVPSRAAAVALVAQQQLL